MSIFKDFVEAKVLPELPMLTWLRRIRHFDLIFMLYVHGKQLRYC